MPETIRFLTNNDGKFWELKQLLDPTTYTLIRDASKIDELQTQDMNKLVRHKAKTAFKIVGRPLIVDHTGLAFGLMNGFPAGLTSVFYDTLGNDGISEIIGKSKDRSVTAVTLIAYCDGRRISTFRGEAKGIVADRSRPGDGFQWDDIFIPEGYDKTYSDVGAGLSRRLGLPSWPQLMGELGEQLDFDADIFLGFSNFLALAEYYQIRNGGSLSGLAKLLDAKWHDLSITVTKSVAHQLIVELGFPRIYTTNYDRWLERAFEHWKRSFRRILKVSDIGDPVVGVTDIVKFHGDFDEPDSLVLTESNYFDRLEFESPLDIMLRADALHRPMLFVGYGLADMNIRYLFHKLGKLWSDTSVAKARKESFIYMTKPNPVEEELFRKWKITPIVDPHGGGEGLQDFLASLGS